MKSNKKIKELIIVEGKTDIAYLSSFLKADFYSVNGSAINEKDIDYLKQVSNTRGLIILTDPDYPGLKIRKYIQDYIPNVKHAYVNKKLSIKNNKVGVAECNKDEVLRALENIIEYSSYKNKITNKDIIYLGLSGNNNSKNLRLKVCDYLNIGYSNNKQFINKLNNININIKELEEIIENVK